ncbi:alpha/beta fold hydrolase [Sphingomonas sp. 35-24ZXX]|uniref:alpha/beta fold hydrolase n=1 Tax=Sphingomonas sp. 35-24ZXX TaxID=1545915 RepID=UPI000AD9AF02|nr:alpha/beta fold hydrolase [Sphingomonas sp. 35-24ZXX]
MSRAQRFLERFRSTGNDHNPLDMLHEDADGFGALLAEAPEALAEAMTRDADLAPAGPAFVNPRAYASAACDAEGDVVCADPAFAAWAAPLHRGRAELGALKAGKASVSYLLEDVSGGQGHGGKFIAVAAAPLAAARHWPLAPEVRRALESGAADYALVAHLPPTLQPRGLASAARLFGFTAREASMAEALVRGGDVRTAARMEGIGYETGRDVIKAAMAKAGCHRQGEFVALCLQIESGEQPGGLVIEPVLRDIFGLTERQARIAHTIARGLTREECAQQLALSVNIVKAELKAIFASCELASLVQLTTLVAHIQAVAALADATDIDLSVATRGAEPLRLLPRRDRTGRIAFADHGPRDGIPMVCLHTATTGRHLPAKAIAALQAEGLRPITLDRPGFGLTAMVEGDYLAHNARDILEILDALGLQRACILARGGTMVLAYVAAHHPERLNRAVVLNPEPPPQRDGRLQGLHGHVKQLVYSRPGLVGPLATHLSRRASARTVERLVIQVVGGSEADRRTLADPEILSGYVRATQQSAMQGGAGFLAIARSEPHDSVVAIADGSAITILCGEQDTMYASADSVPYWQSIWPGARAQVVEGAGRMLLFQRPDLIAAALRGAACD